MFLQGFAKAEMWSIRRQVVREHVLLFPQRPLFLYLGTGMEPLALSRTTMVNYVVCYLV